ncbi:MAG: transketolase family protein [Oscillospiraceae bacterium]|jgi:transketolase|nr:transketolase family protein [Oscillospiraceae bacterium]
MEMRQALAKELDRLMEINPNIVVIDADLSKPNGLMALKKKYPERAFDVGIAEQNMASIAAGMSSYGFIPFINTFTPFATRRICDQIAISIAYAKQNVKIIGTDPGISAEYNGGTHMSFEDIGVLRSIPDIVIFEPVDTVQLSKAMPQILDYNGPVYIRMFRKEISNIFSKEEQFSLFSTSNLQKGNDLSIFCSGLMVQETMKANEELSKIGIKADIINVHTLKPLDKPSILKSVKKTGAVLTVENHNVIGGLKSAICEFLMEEYPVPLKSIGINDKFGQVGKIDYLKKIYKMQAEDIVKAAVEIKSKRKN